MKIKNWLGQATTGTGFATILAGLGAIAGGALDWRQAAPVLAGGFAGVIWPENRALNAAVQQVAGDVGAVLSAYRSTVSPGASSASASQPTPGPHAEAVN